MFFIYKFKKSAVMALLMFSVLFTGAEARTGGPDAFGYTFTDSNEVGGPTYNMIDISATGTGWLSGDDAYQNGINIGFTFPFYGNNYTQLNITTNGWINFGINDTYDYSNDAIPNIDTPNNFIAPEWDDLSLHNNHQLYTQSFSSCPNTEGGTGACMIVMWHLISHWGNNTYEWNLEAILYENGNIIMNHGAGDGEHGSGATVGIENIDGTNGLQYSHNEAVLDDNMAILFSYIPSVTVPLSNSAKALLALLFAFAAFFMINRSKIA